MTPSRVQEENCCLVLRQLYSNEKLLFGNKGFLLRNKTKCKILHYSICYIVNFGSGKDTFELLLLITAKIKKNAFFDKLT